MGSFLASAWAAAYMSFHRYLSISSQLHQRIHIFEPQLFLLTDFPAVRSSACFPASTYRYFDKLLFTLRSMNRESVHSSIALVVHLQVDLHSDLFFPRCTICFACCSFQHRPPASQAFTKYSSKDSPHLKFQGQLNRNSLGTSRFWTGTQTFAFAIFTFSIWCFITYKI